MDKTISGYYGGQPGHWVGDGFPVRSLFSYGTLGQQVSPFLLLDYAGPHYFEPTTARRGVGTHPHRGFETVTIVYEGDVEHRDSEGHSGRIGAGDVQWMTAGRGILHQEYHSPDFAKTGGMFRVVQLWVNLPAKDKMTQGGYQTLLAAEIPTIELPNGAGTGRVIAGELCGVRGPARTFTTINLWDLTLKPGQDLRLELPVGHTTVLVGISGQVVLGEGQALGEAETALLSREGDAIRLRAKESEARLLVLTGEPINEPIAGHGPFVMNTQNEIREAIRDFNSGAFGQMAEV